MLTFGSPLKYFDFLQQFRDQGHDESKVLDETTIKLGRAIKNLNVLGRCWFRHVDYGCNFFRILQLPFFTHNVTKYDIEKHQKHTFFRVEINTKFLTFVKTQSKFNHMSFQITEDIEII